MRESLPLFFLTVFLRGIYFLNRPFENPEWSAHWNLASGLLKYGTLGYAGEKVTNIEPGYPFMIAAGRLLGGHAGFAWLQIMIAGLGAVFIQRLAQTMTNDRRIGVVAAVLYAFYPYLIGQSVQIIEVTLFTSLLAACAYFFSRPSSFKNSVFCGIFFGLALLTRSMIFPAFVMAGAVLLWQKRARDFAVIMLTMTSLVIPWMVRSHAVDGSWVPPRSGWNFLQGNCPYSDKIIPKYNPDLLDVYVNELLNRKKPEWAEADYPALAREMDDFFTAEAWEFIKAHPWRTLKLKLLNVFYLFHPRIVPFYGMDAGTRITFTGPETFEIKNIPKRGILKEAAHSIFYGFIFLTAAAGIFIRRKRWMQDIFLYLIIFNFTAVYALYWPATRLRAPMDFIFMIFSACFLVASFSRKKVHENV